MSTKVSVTKEYIKLNDIKFPILKIKGRIYTFYSNKHLEKFLNNKKCKFFISNNLKSAINRLIESKAE